MDGYLEGKVKLRNIKSEYLLLGRCFRTNLIKPVEASKRAMRENSTRQPHGKGVPNRETSRGGRGGGVGRRTNK